MRFWVDAHFPVWLKGWLIAHGEDALHTSDLPQGNRTSDREIIAFAVQEGRIVITKDKDFIEYRIVHEQPDQLLMVSTGILNVPRIERLVARRLRGFRRKTLHLRL